MGRITELMDPGNISGLYVVSVYTACTDSNVGFSVSVTQSDHQLRCSGDRICLTTLVFPTPRVQWESM